MLSHGGEVDVATIDPVQKCQRDAEGLPQAVGGSGTVTVALGSSAGAVQQMPLRTRPHQPDLGGRSGAPGAWAAD